MKRLRAGIHVDYALQLLNKGFVCLPLRAGGKHLDLAAMGIEPLHLHTMGKRLKEAMFTGITMSLSLKPPGADDIERWFSEFSGNIGILAGHGNLIVLDFDCPAAFFRWRKSHTELVSRTPVAQTPGGFHVYLRSTQPTVTSSLYGGLRKAGHIKALSGYVVSSPSRLQDGSTYSWLPGQSPFDCSPQEVPDLGSLSLYGESPLKRVYDRILKRGYFDHQ
nr:bifunctional DNA primase/polymerase [Desulfuromonas sp. CSMB_57]